MKAVHNYLTSQSYQLTTNKPIGKTLNLHWIKNLNHSKNDYLWHTL